MFIVLLNFWIEMQFVLSYNVNKNEWIVHKAFFGKAKEVSE
jgi:hypothetical protein